MRRVLMAALAAGAWLAAGCKFPPLPDIDDGGPSDANVDGRSCTPSAVSCVDGQLTACDEDGAPIRYTVPNGGPDGSPIDVTLDAYPCPLGCAPGGTRCADVAPSNGLAAALDTAGLASPDVVVDEPTSGGVE